MAEITIEVSDLHEEMLDEVREITDDNTVSGSTENFIHDLYQQARQVQEQQGQRLEIEEPDDRE